MRINTGHCTINIDLSGRADAPVVIMAHSLGCNLHMWDPQLPALESDFRVMLLDMRGHGASDVPAGPYTFDELADDVLAVMDQQGVETAHWVGLSIGGMIGQNLLLRYADRFRSAVLCDTSSTVPGGDVQVWQDRIALIEDQGMQSIVESTLQRWFTPSFPDSDPAACEAVRRQLLATSPTGYIGCCHAIMSLDYTQRLPEITHPVLLMVGEQDPGTPVAASQSMHDLLPDSRLTVLPNASHISNIEQAQAFNASLLSFLQSVD